ncbi:hypothetical protein [Streptomyces sp. WMMB303]|uniref:hypothetical protein n=1 Tax=Streptomyces sp. WMMB303 TaxID=3034154 RepID=UPI0023EA86C7|nr:hypothetical protein [Streptomyces sp. WMMB303]MDF4254561.1 hypothetical protein [Streptomyces sp. WMMB303]
MRKGSISTTTVIVVLVVALVIVLVVWRYEASNDGQCSDSSLGTTSVQTVALSQPGSGEMSFAKGASGSKSGKKSWRGIRFLFHDGDCD